MNHSKKNVFTDWQLFISQIGIPLLITDQKLNLKYSNKNALKLFKRKRFAKHFKLNQLLHSSEQENFADFFLDFEKKKLKNGFDEFRLKVSKTVFASVDLCSIKFSNSLSGFLVIIQDVTGRKSNIEQLRNLLDQKEELFARIHYYQQEILKMVVESEEKERKMIADSIHDRLGSLMASVRLHLEYYETIQKENVVLPENSFSSLKERVDEAISALRIIAHETMPVVLDLGITAALDNLIFYYQKNFSLQISVVYKIDPSRINHSFKVTLYRIVQDFLKFSLTQTNKQPIKIFLNDEDSLFRIKIEMGKLINKNSLKSIHLENAEMQNIYQRVHLFRGTIKWNRIPTDKSGVFIEIPLDD